MKLEVGMYARVKRYWKDDTIIIKITEDNFYQCYNICDEVSKASYNLIDVIEAGDYVNGLPVEFIHEKNFCIYIQDDHSFDIGTGVCNNTYEGYIHENEIISIVTKEQFENCKFKVEKEEYKAHSKVVEFDQFKNETDHKC